VSELIIDDVGVAAQRLRHGGLVAIPTETVYGLAADAEQPHAVMRIFSVKRRPADHPLIVHLPGVEAIDGWVGELDTATQRSMAALAEAAWPGPLTMLVPRGPRVSDEVTGGKPTVGLRVPAHPMTLELLRHLGRGLAAPSANRFGRVSPTTAQHVSADLAGDLEPGRDAILDGGPCPVGVESTIVDLTCSPPQVLRAGAIDADQVERILSMPVASAQGPSRASGMLPAHYAPDCEVLLADDAGVAERLAAERRRRGQRVAVLDRTANLVDAARYLYADLRAADADGVEALVVVRPPAVGLGHAVRDRLDKAAAGSRRA
jgi:L-threonylcarbamoyladenylate synthase